MFWKIISLFVFIFGSASSQIVAHEQTQPTVIYIARHGQTDWNLAGKMQGLTDIPLNETGRSQAAKVAAELANIQIDMAFTSDLMRAYETCSIIVNGHNVDIVSDERLREKSYDSFEGLNYQEYKNTPNHLLGTLENNDSILARAFDFLNTVVQENPGKTLLVVTHAGIVKRVLSSIGQVNDHGADVHNLGYAVLYYQNVNWSIQELHDIDFPQLMVGHANYPRNGS